MLQFSIKELRILKINTVSSKQKFFELVFIALHALEHIEQNQDLLARIMSSFCKSSVSQAKLAISKANEIYNVREKLDDIIASVSQSYKVERITSIEKTLIYTGIFFAMYESLQKNIAIAECLRLTSKFGSQSAIPYVNAVLDASIKE